MAVATRRDITITPVETSAAPTCPRLSYGSSPNNSTCPVGRKITTSALAQPKRKLPAPVECPVKQAKTEITITPVETSGCDRDRSVTVPEETNTGENSGTEFDSASVVSAGLIAIQCAGDIYAGYKEGQAAKATFKATTRVAAGAFLEPTGRSVGRIVGTAVPWLGADAGGMIGAFVGQTVSAYVVEGVSSWLFPNRQQEQ